MVDEWARQEESFQPGCSTQGPGEGRLAWVSLPSWVSGGDKWVTCVYALPIDTVEDLYVRWPGWPHLACGAALLSWSLAHTTAVACHHMHPSSVRKEAQPHTEKLCKQLYRGNMTIRDRNYWASSRQTCSAATFTGSTKATANSRANWPAGRERERIYLWNFLGYTYLVVDTGQASSPLVEGGMHTLMERIPVAMNTKVRTNPPPLLPPPSSCRIPHKVVQVLCKCGVRKNPTQPAQSHDQTSCAGKGVGWQHPRALTWKSCS